MKIALAQMKMEQNMETNFQKSVRLICEAAEKKADLILFPEIQLTPFFPQYSGIDVSSYAMTLEHPYIKGICDSCRTNMIFASPNFYVEENGNRYL